MKAEDYWNADGVNAKALSDLIHDPIFSRAVEVILTTLPTEIPIGPTAIQDSALQGAFERGIRDFPNRLLALTKEKKPISAPTTQPKAWGHITKERSSFQQNPESPEQTK